LAELNKLRSLSTKNYKVKVKQMPKGKSRRNVGKRRWRRQTHMNKIAEGKIEEIQD
jgi:hypothetical protein